ncbi:MULTISPECIES: hypothetical protein [Myroides]|uniref:Uncharacterized protein n=1 Tax=Myroides albus TaxID=2562892 RepID=A0A6I3LDF2_9FLAO|nr:MULTISPECIES: hypothetical protein [Myroides]MTG97529.1 hypothetical protein [Myroides albus]MVX35053.1 hypothetical protein [Myroides sp. LoEW2-1]UVD81194.1 hypothetical protein NWE55_08145 [Myroides albus]
MTKQERIQREIIVLMKVAKENDKLDLSEKIEELVFSIKQGIDEAQTDDEVVLYAKYLKIVNSIKK